MENKELIKKLHDQLKYKDRKKIVEVTGVDKAIVTRFMNGKEKYISDERATLIIDAALDIVSKRAERNKANERKINKIINSI